MKKIFIVSIVALFVAGSLFGGAKKKYGTELTLKQTTKISEIVANPDKFNGKKVLVSGPIVDVCKERGCWIKVGSDKEFESIRFKVQDGVIVFPLDLKGKNAVAEGVVSVRKISVEDQIKSGEEMAKEEGTTFDRSTVTGVKTVLQIKGEGAEVEVK